MNKDSLKEEARHGTDEYAFAQYHIKNLAYPFYMPYHWHDEVEIIYIKKGQLAIVIDGVEYSGKTGDIYIVNPREIHMMFTEDLGVEYFTVLFDMALLEFVKKSEEEKYFAAIQTEEIKIASSIREHGMYKKILALIESLVKANQDTVELYQLDTRINLLRLMKLFMMYTNKEYNAETYDGKNAEVKRFIISYIEENYVNRISLADISEEVHMSEKYFSRFFKENFGINFVDYVNRYRLEKATTMLLNTDDSITDIAFSCGYSNISYFIRSFKKVYGSSPHAFRKT